MAKRTGFLKLVAAALGLGLGASLLLPIPASANPAPVGQCSVANLERSPGIRGLFAEVRNLSTGEVLYSKRANTPQRTASVMKVLTSVVALDALGADHQVTTTVYADPQNPEKLYLVGSGDVTLSRMPGNITSYYLRGPKLDTLSRQIQSWAKANAVTISEVVTDSSLYDEYWHPTWDRRGLTEGYMAPVSALQIDAGRLTSSKNRNLFIAKRTDKPVNQAGVLFLQSLRKFNLGLGATASRGVLPAGVVPIASVKSQPMSAWIGNTLRVSDNALSESLARLSSLALGGDGSAESLTQAYKKVLEARGIDSTGVVIVDGSGLSRLNRVPARVFNDLLTQIYAEPERHQAVIAGLPVSGKPGSLRFRFNAGEQRQALFNIEAKTGWIRTGYSLAGKIKAADGTDLVFTVYNLWTSVSYQNRAAMDALVFGFYRCGASLRG